MSTRRVLIDLSPLREHRDFRLLWLGQLGNNFGRQIALVTVPFQVFSMTGSIGAIGLLAAVNLSLGSRSSRSQPVYSPIPTTSFCPARRVPVLAEARPVGAARKG